MGLKVISDNKSFYGKFESHGILRRFLDTWYFTEVFKSTIFNGGFETIDILHRFLKQWYLTEVVKNFL